MSKLNYRIIKSTKEEREEIRKIQRSKYSSEKECYYCKEKFDYGYNSLKSCLACKIIVKCCICLKEFELNLDNFSGTDQKRINEAFLNKENLHLFCSKECKRKGQAQNLIKFYEENPDFMKKKRQEHTKIKWCRICKQETQHFGNDCLTCHGKNALSKMIQYGKDHPEEEKIHRQNCAKALIKFWDNNPELRVQNSVNNIQNWNNSEEGKKYSIEHCKKLGLQWGSINQKIMAEKTKEKLANGEIEHWPGNCIPNFTIKNGIRYYKNIEIHEFCSKILSGELNINDYPGINIRFGEVYYGAENLLTGEINTLNGSLFYKKNNIRYYLLNGIYTKIEYIINSIESGVIDPPKNWNKRFGEWFYKNINILSGEITNLDNSSFVEKDELWYYDKSISDYIPWENFKVKFLNNITQISDNFVKEIQQQYPKAKIIPTFRTQDSEDWSGARQAFEYSLVEEDYYWFAYIKFDEFNRPLVVGKSGSLNVNSEGSDLSFSRDINDGPSRKFLLENNLDWNKEFILIIPTKDEQEAFNFEKLISERYKLFNS